MDSTILWRRIDQPGFDSARLRERADGAILEGTAVFAEADLSCRLDYLVDLDASWRTVSVHVHGWLGPTAVELVIEADGGHWTLNGEPCPAVDGCEDIDLSFTPATNLLPIRRLRLDAGASAAVRAAWVTLDGTDVGFEVLEQTYRKDGDGRYHYESDGGAFTAELETNSAGLVTRYPGLWEPVPPS